jgi:hypothetical protein
MIKKEKYGMKFKLVVFFLVASVACLFLERVTYADTNNEPIVQNMTLTPGVVDQNATTELICLAGYSGSVRNVSKSTKRKVFLEYGIDPKSDKFEIDHLISLELGGSNDIKNLWPQSYTTKPWNAHVKDKLENHLHRMVCDGIITLETAQKEIATDWIGAYKKYINDIKE